MNESVIPFRPSDEEVERLVRPLTLAPTAWNEVPPTEALRTLVRTAVENDRHERAGGDQSGFPNMGDPERELWVIGDWPTNDGSLLPVGLEAVDEDNEDAKQRVAYWRGSTAKNVRLAYRVTTVIWENA